MLGSKKMFVAGEESDVFKEPSLHMFEGTGPKDLKADECFCKGNFNLGMSFLGDVGDKDHLEVIYLLMMIRITRGPPGYDEDVVHKLTMDNITIQCEEEGHSIEETFIDGKDEVEDPHRYCKVCGWYVKYVYMFVMNYNHDQGLSKCN
uniref:Uncharacterized protein n=1 Tax=Lactuca sativa TaxID=4236 RepID=A0A9R1VVC2_LACSA|nr:hypothetical protein LSAT_V11C400180250 [Lactuca sativa]